MVAMSQRNYLPPDQAEETRRTIRELAQHGLSVKQITARVGKCQQYVSRVILASKQRPVKMDKQIEHLEYMVDLLVGVVLELSQRLATLDGKPSSLIEQRLRPVRKRLEESPGLLPPPSLAGKYRALQAGRLSPPPPPGSLAP